MCIFTDIESNKTMDTYQEIRSCTNCLHCGADENGKSQCIINYKMYKSECKAFAPKSSEIEEKHAKEIASDLISTQLIYGGVLILALVLLVSFWKGFKIAGDYALLALVATGMVCMALAVVAYCIYRSRRKDMERRVRDDVEHKVRGELSKPLTQEAIKEYLNRQNYLPKSTGTDYGWGVTRRGMEYEVYSDNELSAIVHFAIALQKEDIPIVEQLLKCRDNVGFAAKMWIQEYTENNGEAVFTLDCAAEFFVQYIDDFERVFPMYLSCVEMAVHNILIQLYKSPEHQQNGQSVSRGDIYHPEYTFFPSMLESVCRNEDPIEVLTDEEYIRNYIQSKCQDKAVCAEWDSFKINRVENYGNYKMVVYQFPEPKIAPEAKYGAVLLNTNTLDSNYYTLEMSVEDRWYYGGVSEDRHLNYGEAESTDLDRFIEWIFSNDKQIEASTDYNKG